MGAIANDWLGPLSGEFKKPYYKKLYETVKHEYETRQVFPDPNDIFNAFEFTPLSEVKVVAGPRPVLLCEAGCRDSAFSGEHLSGAAR